MQHSLQSVNVCVCLCLCVFCLHISLTLTCWSPNKQQCLMYCRPVVWRHSGKPHRGVVKVRVNCRSPKAKPILQHGQGQQETLLLLLLLMHLFVYLFCFFLVVCYLWWFLLRFYSLCTPLPMICQSSYMYSVGYRETIDLKKQLLLWTSPVGVRVRRYSSCPLNKGLWF